MSDISAADFSAINVLDRESVVTNTLSFLLVVGLPAAFWLSLLELANYALSFGLSNSLRLIVAGGLIGVLAMIWGGVMICARQRRTLELETQLRSRH